MIPIIILAIENDDDREFMTALYMQYHSLMYKLIFDIVKSPWDTEDILQEVLVKLIDKIPTLKSLERQNRINYVAVACKNTAYNFFRDKKPEIMLGDDIDQFGDDCPALDEYFFKEEDLMRLAAVWPLLDEKTRYLLNGKYVLKKSAKELADDLKMPPDNIRMALLVKHVLWRSVLKCIYFCIGNYAIYFGINCDSAFSDCCSLLSENPT